MSKESAPASESSAPIPGPRRSQRIAKHKAPAQKKPIAQIMGDENTVNSAISAPPAKSNVSKASQTLTSRVLQPCEKTSPKKLKRRSTRLARSASTSVRKTTNISVIKPKGLSRSVTALASSGLVKKKSVRKSRSVTLASAQKKPAKSASRRRHIKVKTKPVIGVNGSPNTRAAIKKSVRVADVVDLAELSLSPGGTTAISPGGKNSMTVRRTLDVARENSEERSVVRTLVFERNGAPIKKLPDADEMAALDTVEKKFGPYTLNSNDLDKAPKRKTARSQKRVAGHSAKDEFLEFMKQNSFKVLGATLGDFHWSHLVAYIFVAAATRKPNVSQVMGDLGATPAATNMTQKKYEDQLRALAKSPLVASMTISASAQMFKGSDVAKSIELFATFTLKNGQQITINGLQFDGLRTVRERSNTGLPRVFREILDGLLSRSQDQVPFSANQSGLLSVKATTMPSPSGSAAQVAAPAATVS